MLVPNNLPCQDDHDGPLKVVVLGSTGSVGCSALEVIDKNPEALELVGIAGGSNFQKLQSQIARYKPKKAALADPDTGFEPTNTSVEFHSGNQSIIDLATIAEADVVLAAISGSAGLASTIAALEAGKKVALANKESIICAAPFLKQLLNDFGGQIIPVDSEHSAMFQCLQGERRGDVDHLVLTASGGPFLNVPKKDFSTITPEQALKHPRWEMGAKITIDSATLMNKALEFIEAHWLFDVDPKDIQVVVHPQSIVHSLVAFSDGTQIAQLSHPDMQGAIAHALNYPYGRLENVMRPMSLTDIGKLDFIALDEEKFESIQLARQVIEAGPMATIVLNVANEIAVELFLARDLCFSKVYRFLYSALDRYTGDNPSSIEEVMETVDNLKDKIRTDSSSLV